MNRTMPNKKQIPRVGTKLPQKPMPKQDKGGGIIPAAEGARIVLTRCLATPSIARPKNAGNPRFEYLLFLIYSILILK